DNQSGLDGAGTRPPAGLQKATVAGTRRANSDQRRLGDRRRCNCRWRWGGSGLTQSEEERRGLRIARLQLDNILRDPIAREGDSIVSHDARQPKRPDGVVTMSNLGN